MTVDQMANHAKRYSKGLKKEVTVDQLKALADLPVSTDDNKTVGWLGNFHSMGVKTVVRNLLSKFGYLSVEMQTAIADDMRSEEFADATEVKDDQKQLTMSSEGAVQIGEAATNQTAPATAPNPGY